MNKLKKALETINSINDKLEQNILTGEMNKDKFTDEEMSFIYVLLEQLKPDIELKIEDIEDNEEIDNNYYLTF